MSEMYQRLAHSSWDCKYHVVFVPKRRRKVLFGQARRKLGEVFHALARQKECQIIGAVPAHTLGAGEISTNLPLAVFIRVTALSMTLPSDCPSSPLFVDLPSCAT
jgi:hypothetical protein